MESTKNTIIERKRLSEDVFMMKVNAPLIARERKAGQFIILIPNSDTGERIPLTIADANAEEGWIELIFQAIGKTTLILASKREGEEIAHILGPLGRPTTITKYDAPVVCVGGGIGVAPLYPIAQAFKRAGNRVVIIIGARNKSLIVMEDEMRAVADELIICTDDGSYGRKDLVTAPLKELCEKNPKPGEVVTIGPPVMMKFCAKTTQPYGVHTIASLNTIMIDGTGMCGCCRVTVGDEVKFVCVDGPEFNAHLVDWENMVLRLGAYKGFEAEAAHKCRVGLTVE